MPQTAQSGGFKAPQSPEELRALIAQRDELHGQLRALEDRRFQLAGQHHQLEGTLAVDVERRVKTMDASIDRLERQLAQANELITGGHARFGGQSGAPDPWSLLPGQPAPPALPAIVAVPPDMTPRPDARTEMGRALLLEGVGFLLLGAIAWAWASRRLERKLARRAGGDPAQMALLQQSVDAIALEVERISENQRWVTKVINEKALGAGEARPVDVVAGEKVPAARRS